jgi:spore photoproduct lyase
VSAWRPLRVLVEEPALEYPLTASILGKLGGVPFAVVPDAGRAASQLEEFRDPIGAGKTHLFLAVRRGPFVKPCPCTPSYVCCGYRVINLDLSCPLDCSYCILQKYLGHTAVTVHVNREDLWTELEAVLRADRAGPLRMGTGELGDSLALDDLTGAARDLVAFFRGRPGVYLELKTKTTAVEGVLGTEAAPNVVLAWSLNPADVAAVEERGAPSPAERLAAAGRVASQGYSVAFHFDPLIVHPGWPESYREVVGRLLAAVPVEQTAWISLGSLRFHPSLLPIIRSRFPASRIPGQEFIRGRDGKMRYVRSLREALYRHVLGALDEFGGEAIPVYLCMESAEVWRSVLGQKKRKRKPFPASFPRPSLDDDQRCTWE